MTDYFPERARGERAEGAPAAPPRPDEDERWEYIADHLKAIRASLAFLVAVVILGMIVGVVIVLATGDQSGSSSGF